MGIKCSEENLVLSKKIYEEILATIGSRPPESGGVLGIDRQGIVSAYYFDQWGRSSSGSYGPDVASINRVLAEEWLPRDLLMIGIVHSHGGENGVPSCGDIQYGIRILQALNTVSYFYLPILTVSEAAVRLRCFVIRPDPERLYLCREIPYAVV